MKFLYPFSVFIVANIFGSCAFSKEAEKMDDDRLVHYFFSVIEDKKHNHKNSSKHCTWKYFDKYGGVYLMVKEISLS